MPKTKAFVKLARPHQYLKNGFIFLPLLFGYQLHQLDIIWNTFLAFLSFSVMSSSVYIINDLKDVAEDRQHAVKKLRPIASGDLSAAEAIGFFLILIILSITISLLFLPRLFITIIGGYFFLNLSYTFFLKHKAIIDIVCIGLGFVLRILAGGIVAGVETSPWIVMMTFLLALFLALAKRRDDLILYEQGHTKRKSLDGYNMEFVSLSMGIMAAVIIVSYILYTVSPEIIIKHGTNRLYLTSLWVIIGLLRYLQLTFINKESGSPTLVLLKDLFLQITVSLWFVSIYLLLY